MAYGIYRGLIQNPFISNFPLGISFAGSLISKAPESIFKPFYKFFIGIDYINTGIEFSFIRGSANIESTFTVYNTSKISKLNFCPDHDLNPKLSWFSDRLNHFNEDLVRWLAATTKPLGHESACDSLNS